MRNKGCVDTIRARIEDSPAGAVFSLADFADAAEPKTVSKTLGRLARAKVVEKIARGLVWKPLPGAGGPSPDEVARALARANSWASVPVGETAKHIVGLESNEPEVWTYLTEGSNRVYKFDGFVISFKHASARFLRGISYRTALLIQVVRAYGKDMMSSDVMTYLVGYFGRDFRTIVEESRKTTVWIYRAIADMFRKHRAELSDARN